MSVNSNGYIHLGGNIRNIYILLLLSLSYSATLLVPDEYSTIQSAIDAASDGDSVLVSAGIYYENITWPETNGIKLIGSGEEACFIDGDSLANVIRFVNLGGIIDSTTLITGFTIQNGNAQGDYPYDRGGGMFLSYSSPTLTGVTFSGNMAINGGGMSLWPFSNSTLTDVTFSGNSASGSGGGMLLSTSSNSTLTNVTFSGNTATWGGGMYITSSSSSTLTDVTFSSNSASSSGGGMQLYLSSSILIGVTFSGNTAPNDGGGMFLSYSSAALMGVTFSGNMAINGGGMFLSYSSPTLTGVTFNGNTANQGGGMFLRNFSHPTLINSILWGNSPMEICFWESEQPATESNSITVTYSDIQGGEDGIVTYDNGTVYWGDGNIDADPQFIDPENGDYTLQPTSPCIDTGTADTDGDGYDDITDYFGFAPDMGAFEQMCESGVYDDCLVCDGSNAPNTGICDCLGVPNGTNYEDGCGICDDNPDNDIETCGGCTDPTALNYNSDATIDDGSCIYNQAPVAPDSLIIINEDYELTIYLSANDPEEDALTFSIVDMPVNGNLTIDGAVVLYTPNTDFNGTDSFTFIANDGEYDSNIATVQLAITPVNDPPVLTDEFEDITIYQLDTETIEIDNFHDIDNELTYSAESSDISIANAVVVNASLVLIGNNGGVAEITVSATDGEYEITDSFDIYVENICDLGDVNCDGTLNVLDIVLAANMVLADEYDEIADMNEDGELNILDLVIMVNWVLDGDDGACVDIDGNTYETVQIGDQLWMAENLRVTHYNDGSEIPTGLSSGSGGEWETATAGAYVVYPLDDDGSDSCGENCADIYGNLYNWYAVDDERGVCPEGFHVPSDEEFKELEIYLGMCESSVGEEDYWMMEGGCVDNTGGRGTDEGAKLKEIGLEHWEYPNPGATNESGFTGLPGGYRVGIWDWEGSGEDFYNHMRIGGNFWSSTKTESLVDENYVWYRSLWYEHLNVNRYLQEMHWGFSVRCLGD